MLKYDLSAEALPSNPPIGATDGKDDVAYGIIPIRSCFDLLLETKRVGFR